MYDTVVVITDPECHELGIALRGVLDAFRVHCDYHHCVQRPKLLEALGGGCARSEHVVLCVHGWLPPEPEALNFRGMVDLVDGRWGGANLQLTPQGTRQNVRLEGQTVLVLGGCNGGSPGLAQAWLDAGASHYIASEKTMDADAALVFAIGFFYHLMLEDRDAGAICSVEEAVARAAAVDTYSQEGTHLYRCFTRS